jgi:hypothetical protein
MFNTVDPKQQTESRYFQRFQFREKQKNSFQKSEIVKIILARIGNCPVEDSIR